ncbi:MICOS complex subunit MIC60-2 [Caenorhabditis elegans]|uniref:MICOS complex subunit MIC60-2 n=1 Tax=Caenorhabditis elegans TaxID=6239 RepID=IMMT2_CAEEL|nr:MICOS complex subunit MIC60-2 [Caenorhabditis elegans]Q9XXN2.2 RecName: Full=MICOS complex subunit MIC60-2; AltName: Full=Inner mitochondrial membrane protein 2; AltName: Full=Mitofilin homolog 2; Flags: Precursor [Caenorhabditis elegans]CAA16516.2 MICOS complex subunit MIC60-2 [Caenorhabditis elegans]|eukprot:NP_507241.2 MICOS complex subunit MIC60-2 [Caenorhabditis elegans]
MRGSRNLLTQRLASSRATGSSGGLKFVGATVGAVTAGAAGVAGYASYDNEFRKKLEGVIPGSRTILNYTIGEEEPPAPRLKDLRPLQYSADPKVPPKPFEPKPVKKELIGVKENLKETTEPKKIEKKPENPYIGAKTPLNPQERNEKLTESLKNHLTQAEKATKVATSAKLETIRAIEHHVQTIREAIEAGKDGDWDSVTVAHLKAKRLAEKDEKAEKLARNAVADLVTEANLGGQGETTQLNPLVPISKATAEKLSNELDEMISNVKHVDSERIFVHDYSDRVAESRRKFQMELKAVHPNLNYEDGMKIKKADLHTILAHAHLRIDQLSQKLIDSKLNEEKRIQSIIAKKKEDLLEKLRLETNAKQAAVIPEFDKKKLDAELARATAEIQKKYDEKLKEVVRTQKQLYDIEHAKDVDEAVLKERNLHSSAVGKALAQLAGIEKALSGHLQMDIENRKSKQMWLATQNLKGTVIFGNRASCCMEGRRAPLGDQMKTLLSCCGGGNSDEFVKTINTAMSKTSKVRGEYTEQDLNTRFNKVCRIGRRVAYVNEGGALAHLYSWLKSSLTIELVPKKGANESLTPAVENNFTLLTRAEQLWKSGKKSDAIRVLQLTDGATRRVAADFIADARRQHEALLLSRLLLAHAALTSIRSTY